MCDIVYEPSLDAAALILEPGQQPPDGWPLVAINPNAPWYHISEELQGIGSSDISVLSLMFIELVFWCRTVGV